VRIAIQAAGISFVDVLTAEGRYQIKPPMPCTPGSESAGVIRDIGTEVSGLSVGDQVSASGWGGLFAKEAVLPARGVRKFPDALSFTEAAVSRSAMPPPGTGWLIAANFTRAKRCWSLAPVERRVMPLCKSASTLARG
jgi:NADPH:quinone reductase-like Zn-dependent oxidoreductase